MQVQSPQWCLFSSDRCPPTSEFSLSSPERQLFALSPFAALFRVAWLAVGFSLHWFLMPNVEASSGATAVFRSVHRWRYLPKCIFLHIGRSKLPEFFVFVFFYFLITFGLFCDTRKAGIASLQPIARQISRFRFCYITRTPIQIKHDQPNLVISSLYPIIHYISVRYKEVQL